MLHGSTSIAVSTGARKHVVAAIEDFVEMLDSPFQIRMPGHEAGKLSTLPRTPQMSLKGAALQQVRGHIRADMRGGAHTTMALHIASRDHQERR